jgi:hypothetical protein
VVDTKGSKISLTIRSVDMGSGSVKMAGTPAPEAPVIPTDWTVRASPGGGIFDTFTIEPYYHPIDRRYYPRVFEIHGDLSDPGNTAQVNGGFFLGTKNKLYGDYEVEGSDDEGKFTEEGVLSGTITLSPSAKFTMTAVSEDKRSKATLKGIPK